MEMRYYVHDPTALALGKQCTKYVAEEGAEPIWKVRKKEESLTPVSN